MALLRHLLLLVHVLVEDRQRLVLENAALSHQLVVLKRSVNRPSDSIYGWEFDRAVEVLGIRQLRTAPRSPWQNAYVERVIGTLRRECTDHIIPMGQRHLLRKLGEYVEYYNDSRPHQSLDRNSPLPRNVEADGEVCASPVLGGLHHRYFRAA